MRRRSGKVYGGSTVEEALEAEVDGADYLGAGPLFATPTKAVALPATGPGILGSIRQAVRIPLVGTGGINYTNTGDIIRAGGDGAAVVSAITASPEPGAAARALRSVIDEVRCGR